MTSHELCRLQAALKMKNRDLEVMFEVSDQTVVNWRRGYSRIPAAVAIVIRQLFNQGTK